MIKPRTVMILIDTKWQVDDFKNLRKGCMFKIYESNGDPAHEGQIYRATSNPYDVCGDLSTIDCEVHNPAHSVTNYPKPPLK